MRVLIVYASHFGQTRKIAERLATHLRQHGADIDLVDAAQALPPPTAYDVVVLGSRVEMGKHAQEVRTYITANIDELASRPTAFFSVSNAAAAPGAGPDPSGYLQAMFDELAWRPTVQVAFAGALKYRDYGWILRLVMKRISRSAGHTTDTSCNHEFTSWTQVLDFADRILRLAPRREPWRRESESARRML